MMKFKKLALVTVLTLGMAMFSVTPAFAGSGSNSESGGVAGYYASGGVSYNDQYATGYTATGAPNAYVSITLYYTFSTTSDVMETRSTGGSSNDSSIQVTISSGLGPAIAYRAQGYHYVSYGYQTWSATTDTAR